MYFKKIQMKDSMVQGVSEESIANEVLPDTGPLNNNTRRDTLIHSFIYLFVQSVVSLELSFSIPVHFTSPLRFFYYHDGHSWIDEVDH